MVVKPGQERRAGGRTLAVVVEVGEAETLLRQAVYTGCANLSAVGTQIRISYVVSQNEDQIGPPVGSFLSVCETHHHGKGKAAQAHS